MERALLVNGALRAELEGKRNPGLTADEIESNVTSAKEAAMRALPEFKDGTDVEELVAAYSPIVKSSEPPGDGTATTKRPSPEERMPIKIADTGVHQTRNSKTWVRRRKKKGAEESLRLEFRTFLTAPVSPIRTSRN